MIYDYIIVGAGAAGMQLALEFVRDPYFEKKNILVIDKTVESTNDKTWCYWEMGEGLFDNILTKSWNEGVFYAKEEEVQLQMGSYRYKMLEQENFIADGTSKLKACPWITLEHDQITSCAAESAETVRVNGLNNSYLAKQVFDSRVDEDTLKGNPGYVQLLQHFKGWHITTQKDCFDASKFVMMDFRVQDAGTTNFMYVLPLNSREGLIEFTYFSEQTVQEEKYDKHLKQYLSKILQTESYEILRTEKGVIPMTSFPFQNNSKKNILKIGTAGGWVKPSTGYSFRIAGKKAKGIVQNIKQNNPLTAGLFNTRHKHLDRIFLNVLSANNAVGQDLFLQMYKRNKTYNIFKFLDEETTIVEELRIINSFSKTPFIKEIFSK